MLITWLLLYPLFAFGLKRTPIRVGDVFRVIRRPLLLSALMYLTMFAAQTCLSYAGMIVALLGASLIGIGLCS